MGRTGPQQSGHWRLSTMLSVCAKWTLSYTTSPPPTSKHLAAVPGGKKHSNQDHLFETPGCFRPLRRAVSCLENRPDKRSRIGARNQTNYLPPLMWTSACAVKPTVMKYTLKYRLQHRFKWPCVLPVSGNKASAEVKGKQLGWQ